MSKHNWTEQDHRQKCDHGVAISQRCLECEEIADDLRAADLARLRAELGAARARVAELEDVVLTVIGEHGPLGKHGHLCNRLFWQSKVARDAGFVYDTEHQWFVRSSPPEGGGAS